MKIFTLAVMAILVSMVLSVSLLYVAEADSIYNLNISDDPGFKKLDELEIDETIRGDISIEMVEQITEKEVGELEELQGDTSAFKSSISSLKQLKNIPIVFGDMIGNGLGSLSKTPIALPGPIMVGILSLVLLVVAFGLVAALLKWRP